MKLTILGCHSATPKVTAHPTAQVLEIKGHLFLIDCGEGTQVQLRRTKVKFSRIRHIFISHLHGDHFFGLIGLISTFRLLGREANLHIYGPKGIKEAITLQLKLGNSWTNYPLLFHELDGNEPEIIFEDEKVSVENLKKIGYNEAEAMEYTTAYNVYQSGKKTAQRQDVLNGFGNNGGEEFLSFLQTGESLVVNQDKDWRKWYDDMSGRILKIQNPDGSWNGHHCITSPVFCTATSLLLLTVENDIDFLSKVGE